MSLNLSKTFGLIRPMTRSLLLSTSTLTRFAVNGVEAALALDFIGGEYRTANTSTTFADAFTGTSPKLTYSTAAGSNSTMVNSSGNIVWAPHNLVPYSEDFANATWQKVGAAAIDSTLVTGPDGTLSGRRLLSFDDAAGDRLVELVSITNATLTASMWVKGEGDNIGKDIQLNVKRAGGTNVSVDTDHTLTADWERIHATFTQDPTNTGARIVLVNPNNGNEASEVLIYGAQVEAGSFPTSYIPTSGSQSTRSPDIASIPVTAFGYNQEAGTLVVEFGAFSVGSLNAAIASLTDDPVSDDWAPLLYLGPSSLEVRTRDTGVDQAVITILGDFRTSGGIVGTAMKENSFAASVNGSTPITDSSGTMPTDVSIMRIGTFASNPAYLNGHIKSLKYYPRRLTDAQLQELTA